MKNLKKFKIIFTLFIILISSVIIEAKVKLPTLITDGMILQRNQNVTIWGSADSGEKVNLKFLNKKYQTIADKSGNWKIKLAPMKAGGPF